MVSTSECTVSMRRRRLSRAPALHGDGRHSARKARIRRDGRVRLRVEIVEALGCVPRDVRLVQTNRPAQARSIVSDTDKMRARSSREGCCGWAHRKKGRSAARVARLWIVRTAWSVRLPSWSTASSLLSCHHQPPPLLRAQAAQAVGTVGTMQRLTYEDVRDAALLLFPHSRQQALRVVDSGLPCALIVRVQSLGGPRVQRVLIVVLRTLLPKQAPWREVGQSEVRQQYQPGGGAEGLLGCTWKILPMPMVL